MIVLVSLTLNESRIDAIDFISKVEQLVARKVARFVTWPQSRQLLEVAKKSQSASRKEMGQKVGQLVSGKVGTCGRAFMILAVDFTWYVIEHYV